MPKMNVAMMQPSFLPWQGFFELICRADRFVFLDDFQFSVQSYHQRNRLFSSPEKVDWFTVPVDKNASFRKPLNQTVINEATPWRNKMWQRLAHNYRKAPHFRDVAPFVETWILGTYPSLAAQNMVFIRYVCERFGWDREFLASSSMPSSKQRSARVLEILQTCRADRYYCAHGSFEYMKDDGVFPVANIEVLFQDFQPRPYPQVGSRTFVPFLSVLDAILNEGFERTANLIESGTEHWLSWSEMLARSTTNGGDPSAAGSC